jgi:putative membrane protein
MRSRPRRVAWNSAEERSIAVAGPKSGMTESAMKSLAVVTAAVVVGISTLGLVGNPYTGRTLQRHMNVTSGEFVKKAAEAGQAEVAMGKLGTDKATDPEVKAFAKKMVADRGEANDGLKAAAAGMSLEIPASPGLMHEGVIRKFEQQKADRDFDRDFMQQMVKDHESAVELFESATTDEGVDPDLRSLAKRTLPTLRQHLKAAEALATKLGT